MDIYLGQKAKHKNLDNGRKIFEIVGIRKGEVELEGDYSGDYRIAWLPKKGLILQNMWGAWIDSENDS